MVVTKGGSPLDKQVGGDHYKQFKIQPVEFIEINSFGFLQGTIIKRVACFRMPTSDGIEELEKAKHEIDLLIMFEKERRGQPTTEELLRDSEMRCRLSKKAGEM